MRTAVVVNVRHFSVVLVVDLNQVEVWFQGLLADVITVPSSQRQHWFKVSVDRKPRRILFMVSNLSLKAYIDGAFNVPIISHRMEYEATVYLHCLCRHLGISRNTTLNSALIFAFASDIYPGCSSHRDFS